MSVTAAWAFAVAAVLYGAWIPGEFTAPRIDRIHGFVSELAARDQPWSPLFRLTDAGAGLACLAGTALVPRIPREWLGWLGLAAFGLFTCAGALFPLDCATLSDPACGPDGRSFAHQAHAVAGSLAMAGVVVSMMLLSRTALAWGVTAAMAVATALTLVAAEVGTLVGIAQRIQLGLVVLWLLYLSTRLLTRRPPADARPPHVLRAGGGPAVLLCSGLGRAWFHWDEVVTRLPPGHTVIRFDRPGLGLSPTGPFPPSLYGEAARLAALAPAFPERVTVVAHSAAAWHAEAFARLHPLRVGRLVLVDPDPGTDPRPPARWASEIGRWLPGLGGTWGAQAVARCVGPAAHLLLAGVPDRAGVYRQGGVVAAATGEWLARAEMAAELAALRASRPFPEVPVVVISAGRRRGQERLAELLGGTLLRCPGSGAHLERDAAETVVRACSATVGQGRAVRVSPLMFSRLSGGNGCQGEPDR